MSTGVRLALGSIVIAAATGYMAYLGASAGWSYYVTTDECARRMEELRGCRVRVSGQVVAGSLMVAPRRESASFRLAGQQSQIEVRCRSTVPDTLAEGKDVVVEGRIGNADILEANQVLTRCASKYEPAGETATTAHRK